MSVAERLKVSMRATRICAAALLVSPWVSAQSEVDRPMSVNLAIEREISAGQIHRYSVDAPLGAFLRAEIDGPDTDLTVRLMNPSGRELFETENFDRLEHFSVEWIAPSAGPHRIQLEHRKGRAQTYRLTLFEVRPARPEDHRRIEAQGMSIKAHRLRLQATA